MLMEPLPGDVLGHIPEVKLRFRPPFVEWLFDRTGVFKSRVKMFRVIVHSAIGRDLTPGKIASFPSE